MANPEHLKILKQGVDHWNRWRKEKPEVEPDLSRLELSMEDCPGVHVFGANLMRADLRMVNLCWAKLSNADLSEADLSQAILSGARLFNANLSRAKLNGVSLNGAELSRANFSRADLSQARLRDARIFYTDFTSANLSEADLVEARFNRANLLEADIKEAHLGDTIFSDVDLSHVKGLETCAHMRSSSIDHKTLIQSGPLPKEFLRGCGFPDQFIEHLPGLLGSLDPIQFYSCFISYSSADDEFTKRLHSELQVNNVRCWFAPEDMKIGDKIRPRIDEVIHIHDKLLLVLSENSVNSEWVEKEVETALEQERVSEGKETVLFPIRLDDSVMDIKTGWPADIKRSRHIGDFTKWKDHDSFKTAFERLLRDLGKEG